MSAFVSRRRFLASVPSGLALASRVGPGLLRAAAPVPAIPDAWTPVPGVRVGGILGQRLRLWRENRLWRVVNDPFLLAGFESPPGTHPWQGEHVGKWLHAATLAQQATGDARILRALQQTARRLVACQAANGYIGTYAPEQRFYAPPGPHTPGSWDVWTSRYVIFGLLAYEQFHPDPAIVNACVRLGDLLADTFGPGRADLTGIGSRHGMSSAVLLESIMKLHERTGEGRFLEFAEHIHRSMEANRNIRLVGSLSAGVDVSIPGDGKAYQLMSVLLGYGELFRYTGRDSYFAALKRAWTNIHDLHTYETGGPWSYKSDMTRNHECFADPRFFHPTNFVETCSTATWVQLSLEMLKLTGQAEFGNEAERAVFNQLMSAQSPNGRDWAYFKAPNMVKRDYNDVIHCCGSSGPRALETYACNLVRISNGALSLNSYLPLHAPVSGLGPSVKAVSIAGDYPFGDRALLRLELREPARFAVDLRVPAGAEGIDVTIGGARQPLEKMSSGFLRLVRTWEPGEAVRIGFRFPLRGALQRARDGRTWVAFRRGPLVLAQGVATAADDSEIPSASLQVGPGGADALVGARSPGRATSKIPLDGNQWLEAAAGDGPRYRIKGTDIVLMPYFQAGSDRSSVRTYFPLQA